MTVNDMKEEQKHIFKNEKDFEDKIKGQDMENLEENILEFEKFQKLV